MTLEETATALAAVLPLHWVCIEPEDGSDPGWLGVSDGQPVYIDQEAGRWVLREGAHMVVRTEGLTAVFALRRWKLDLEEMEEQDRSRHGG